MFPRINVGLLTPCISPRPTRFMGARSYTLRCALTLEVNVDKNELIDELMLLHIDIAVLHRRMESLLRKARAGGHDAPHGITHEQVRVFGMDDMPDDLKDFLKGA